MLGLVTQRLRATMRIRSLRNSCLLTSFAILAGFLSVASDSQASERIIRTRREVKIHVDLQDTGKTISLPLGVDLIVTLPMKTYDDNDWYIYRNEGVPLKLIAGPNELRGRNHKPWSRQSQQVFYFRKEAPGVTHLVLEQDYFSKPMILKVVDGEPIPTLPPPAKPVPPPIMKQKVVLRGIHFDFDKSEIRSGDSAVLDEDVSSLKANPNVAVNVNGYCDSIGSEEYNVKLSDRRADAVINYLVKAGIPSSRLIPHGYGKTNFVATNDTAEGRAENRRVELTPNE